jgi:HK97 gp10 family phage protein
MNIDSKKSWKGEEVILAARNTTNKSNYEIGMMIEADAKMNCPSNDGILRGSISVSDKGKKVDGFPEAKEDEAFVGTVVDYAPYVEYGSGPHKTNVGSQDFVDKITTWAMRKGIANPWPIIKHIRKYGTDPQPFMRPALDRMNGDVVIDVYIKNGKVEFKDYIKEGE